MPDNAYDGQVFSSDSNLVDHVQPSPNFGERATGKALDMVVLHYTGMPNAAAALKWLCMEKSQVSCHYLVMEDGQIVQLVRESNRAWHAGQSCWREEADINSRSIGIEIANPGHEHGYVDFPESQMVAVEKLLRDIIARNQIPAANILAHSDIAPLRKEDPGERFDWERLYRAGIGEWVPTFRVTGGGVMTVGDAGDRVRFYQNLLHKLGFDLAQNGKFDELTRACTIAFQRRYRQQNIDGVADGSTVLTLEKLLTSAKEFQE